MNYICMLDIGSHGSCPYTTSQHVSSLLCNHISLLVALSIESTCFGDTAGIACLVYSVKPCADN